MPGIGHVTTAPDSTLTDTPAVTYHLIPHAGPIIITCVILIFLMIWLMRLHLKLYCGWCGADKGECAHAIFNDPLDPPNKGT